MSRQARLVVMLVLFAVLVAVAWATAYFINPTPPRHIVLASGLEDGLLHQYAKRYAEILRRAGVTVEERLTNGAGENMRLLEDPHSGVDVAFTQGGITRRSNVVNVVMLATLYNVPMWTFYRVGTPLHFINELRQRQVAVGVRGSGAASLARSILGLNGLTDDNVTLVPLGNEAALNALQSGRVDAAIFVDGAESQAVAAALRDPAISLLNYGHAEAYPRRLPYLSRLTLPAGVIDLAHDIPERDVDLIGTRVMLAGRDGLHPALIALLLDASREIFGGQSLFAQAGDFPATAPVDLPVSVDAERHLRFGPTFLYRYLPFWVAALAERAIIILLPLMAILFPLVNYLPQFLRWRARSRIYRWYGELTLLERDIARHGDPPPTEKWLGDLDRIDRAVARLRPPAAFASEAYTLREHIDMVRSAVMARNGLAAPVPQQGETI